MSTRYQQYQKTDTNDLVRAMRNPLNFESILLCNVVFIVIGILMMVFGGIVCLIYYTEITPPNFDDNYHRYVGSSMPRIVGPLMVAFGGLLFFGAAFVASLTMLQYYKRKKLAKEEFEKRTATKTVT